jgi:hypothetical protein
MPFRLLCALSLFLIGCQPAPEADPSVDEPDTLRITTFNLEDVRTDDLLNPDHPRLKHIATIIQRIRPDVILLNEIAYDRPGAPGYQDGDPTGLNGQRFADSFLGTAQAPELEPLSYRAVMRPSNTGLSSGFDLNNNGETVTTFPEPPSANPDGSPGAQTPEGREYGNDAWGFGTFPGQYAFALLVRDGLEILEDDIRTFQTFPWSTMPDALVPIDPETGQPWYNAEEWAAFRLSSKTHMDVPIRVPSGAVLHALCSHPTPPAFDGPENRNKTRNHDEIRLWADYLNGANYLIDDAGRTGGLDGTAHFVILGDQNADPDEGSSINDPIGTLLLSHPRINGSFTPKADRPHPTLDADDTAGWGLRVDYVLPSKSLEILNGRIVRPTVADSAAGLVSDHFPVWLDVVVPRSE